MREESKSKTKTTPPKTKQTLHSLSQVRDVPEAVHAARPAELRQAFSSYQDDHMLCLSS